MPSHLVTTATKSRPRPSTLYPVLWQFAFERQRMYLRRLLGMPQPWSSDPVLTSYRFTNAFRAADRVSQHLIRLAYADREASRDTLFLRTILFKVFNRIDTWQALVQSLGLPVAERFDYVACDDFLTRRRNTAPIYSAAYIMPSGPGSRIPKHRMHLRLIRDMLADGLPAKLEETRSLRHAYQLLRAWPTLGPFLAFQYAVDLNYTSLTSHLEQDFVVAGPGALDGLAKCFESTGELTPAETIVWLTERQDAEFQRYELPFSDLWGRPLQPVDVQNLLCEVSKYTRVAHPSVKGLSGRTRIKQRFAAAGPLPKPYFPPKWGLNRRVDDWLREHAAMNERSQATQAVLPLADSDSGPRNGGHD